MDSVRWFISLDWLWSRQKEIYKWDFHCYAWIGSLRPPPIGLTSFFSIRIYLFNKKYFLLHSYFTDMMMSIGMLCLVCSVALCFLVTWALRKCTILIVTSPVFPSRYLLTSLSSMKFLLLRKRGLHLSDRLRNHGIILGVKMLMKCGVFSWCVFTV